MNIQQSAAGSVPFYGAELAYVVTDKQQVMVPVRPICERLGIASNMQIVRLKADERRWGGYHMIIHSAGGEQETFCIPLTRLAAWLFSINVNKVKPEFREGLIRYQDEAAEVLDRHFRQQAHRATMEVEEMAMMLWFAGQNLRIKNLKWNSAYLMMEMGESDYIIAKRLGMSLTEWGQEKAMMKRCGLNPTWRQDMAVLSERYSDLKWRVDRAIKAGAQGDLFGGH